MTTERVTGCIFEDTPKECSMAVNGRCIGFKLRCIFAHQHLIITDIAKEELIELFKEEISTKRRFKHLSGQAGRLLGEITNEGGQQNGRTKEKAG